MSTWDDNSPEADAAAQAGEAESDIRKLREAAKRGNKASEEATALKREMAFMKAGIDTESAQGKLLVQTFGGDLTVEAIKSYQKEVFGVPGQTFVNEGDEPTAAELESAQARQNLAASGNPGGQLATPDPYETVKANARRAIDEGNEPIDEVLALSVHELRKIAASGDPRVDARTSYPLMTSNSFFDVGE